ncbi:ovomucoid-like [Peromyscus eremicus]|uniref:ovomucoid-like n=1 Tax=Peromyscus eremicus TaxID=42410 RepID=UPI0027DE4488|nr:ovomucoid-like [Peromyscus eremicus]
MLVFSRVTYITLSFLLFSESFFIISAFYRSHTMCRNFVPSMNCPKENKPVCATNSRTFTSRCTFCKAYKESNGKIKFKHYGKC